MTNYAKALALEFKLNEKHVEDTIALIDEGNTIPFIARYRKEVTGSMDDQTLRDMSERLIYLRKLDEQKQTVVNTITEQGAMTSELEASIEKAKTMAELEDIYRPYKPKRKTRASVAKAKGLQPLADAILEQNEGDVPSEMAKAFVSEEKEVENEEKALAGACDIIAEAISDDADIRATLRSLYKATSAVQSKAAKPDEDSVYSGYYEFSEQLSKMAGHRILAIDRGEREGFLKVDVSVDEQRAYEMICKRYVKNESECAQIVKNAAQDSFSRLIEPSLEREMRSELTQKACEGAIKVFSKNLEQLLLAPPIKGKIALGLDPGYRMGCKTAVVDGTGKVLDTAVIFPVPEFKRVQEASQKVKELIKKHKVEIIAIGNGTASKETEIFTAQVLKEIDADVQYMVVNEAGASVYSASKLAAQEFPEFDVNLRSAVSIARRLQDPLAELVKIDPKAVGVGQYQHDMPPAQLSGALDGVVEYCVNTVGVDLNTASAPLLLRVAGMSAATAKNVITYREENGEFKSRKQLLKVPKLGPKAYMQCAGFLRVPNAKNKLDTTAVHPESYDAAQKLLELCGYSIQDIGTQNVASLKEQAQKQGFANLCAQIGVGEPTLLDMIDEILRPGRDMRDNLPKPLLRTDVMDMKDLKAGMQLTGTVRNVIDFGAFVDIGVHQDGLVHISQICDRYIKHPSEVLKVGDVHEVWVISVDMAKKRIALTMKEPKAQTISG